MQLPPFTAKSALLYLLGIAALLLAAYFIAASILRSTPHQGIEPTKSAHARSRQERLVPQVCGNATTGQEMG